MSCGERIDLDCPCNKTEMHLHCGRNMGQTLLGCQHHLGIFESIPCIEERIQQKGLGWLWQNGEVTWLQRCSHTHFCSEQSSHAGPASQEHPLQAHHLHQTPHEGVVKKG